MTISTSLKSIKESYSANSLDALVRIISEATSQRLYKNKDHVIQLYPIIQNFLVFERVVFKLDDDPSKPKIVCRFDRSKDLREQLGKTFDDIDHTSYVIIYDDKKFNWILSIATSIMVDLMHSSDVCCYLENIIDELIELEKNELKNKRIIHAVK